jgi:hypothetical protein
LLSNSGCSRGGLAQGYHVGLDETTIEKRE